MEDDGMQMPRLSRLEQLGVEDEDELLRLQVRGRG